MAKSNGFFGMRRGSTKSLTFSVLDGKQITKDRVAQVANPKSQKQQYQRAIMATVMAAYSEMKDIVDHSFQGKKKGSENQREFMSRNLVAMRNAFLQYQEDNPVDSQQRFWAVGPKTPTVLPCDWIISSGTMPASNLFYYDDADHTLAIKAPYGLPYREEGSAYKLRVGDALEALGVKLGTQVTLCCITANNGLRIFQVYSEDHAGYYDFEFHYGRFIVKKDVNLDEELTTPTADGLNTLMRAFLFTINDSKSTILIGRSEDWTVTGEGTIFKIDAEIAGIAAQFDESLTAAVGTITSMVDEDLRSNSKMLVRAASIPNMAQGIGLSWDYVWDAWRNASQSLGDSQLYLEGGSV